MSEQMRTTKQQQESTKIPPFKNHVITAMQDLRAAIIDALASTGADTSYPQEMARQLGLDKSLAWKVSRVVREPNMAGAVTHVPGRSGLKILEKAFRRAGTPKKVVETYQRAVSDFENMVKIHAGNRSTLGMMMSDLSQGGEQQQFETFRKLSFQGNSMVWGVQARVQLTASFIAPNDTGEMVDLAWLSGLVDFRRLRHNVPWAIASAKKCKDDGTVLPVGRIDAIDPDYAGKNSAPLLGDFCTKPIPEMRTKEGPDNDLRFELAEGPVGNTAALTCMVGLYGRSFVKRYREVNDTLGEHWARLSTPVELLIHDLFVHKDLDYALSPEIFLYSMLPGGPVYPVSGRDCGMLPVAEKVFDLGLGLNGVTTPEIKQYKQMVQSIYDRVGWDSEMFYGFRFLMRYPPIPSLAILRYELPERP